jgi:hypothetical protein
MNDYLVAGLVLGFMAGFIVGIIGSYCLGDRRD